MVFIRNLIFYLIGLVPTIFLKKHPKNANNYLFVLLSNPLGDFVSRLKFLCSINLEETDQNFFLIVDKKFEELKYLLPDRIEIIFIESDRYKLNPLYRYKMLSQINSIRFELAINLSVDRGMFSDEVTLKSNSQKKGALQRKSDFLSSFFTTNNNKNYSWIFDFSSSNEYDKLEALKNRLKSEYGICFGINSKVKQNESQEDYIVVAPFSSKHIQSWPIENYLELIEQLKSHKKIVVLGNPKTTDERILNYSDPLVKNLILKTNLSKADEIIAKASLFIGNDSGLTHLAYFHRIPLVAIIGGGNHGQFFPHGEEKTNKFLFHPLDCFNCRWKCKYSEPFCLTNLPVASVLDTVKELL